MRAVVVEHAAAVFPQALPVASAHIAIYAPVYGVDGSQHAALNNFSRGLCFGCEAVGLIEKDAAVIFFGLGDHAICRGEGGGHGFFEDDVTTRVEGANGHVFVQCGRRGNGDHVGQWAGPERFKIGVGFTTRCCACFG